MKKTILSSKRTIDQRKYLNANNHNEIEMLPLMPIKTAEDILAVCSSNYLPMALFYAEGHVLP